MFCLQGKQNISVSYVNGGWVRVWERGSVRDNEQTLCFIIIQIEFVWCHPCLYIWNAILHALDWGVYLIWIAGIVQLGVICVRLVRYGVSSNECSQRTMGTDNVILPWCHSSQGRHDSIIPLTVTVIHNLKAHTHTMWLCIYSNTFVACIHCTESCVR